MTPAEALPENKNDMAGVSAARLQSKKLFGRAFYESIGSPKYIVAPMVDQSEYAWRKLTRSFLPPEQRSSILCYSPMLHSRLFGNNAKYRTHHFEPLRTSLPSPPGPYHDAQYKQEDRYLDGDPVVDRPLFVQFCANDPDEFLQAARHVQPFCDAVDLNLGCPQGIARKGQYGAFLQEDWDKISKLISKLHKELEVPVTAKMRILETPEKTLQYAKMILAAGASIITVHGRLREQKGHHTGLADWTVLRYLRDNLPPETVIFANGNILQHEDIAACLEATGADGVMSAEGNLSDPTIFAAAPPPGEDSSEYWRGKDGKGGYRVDAIFRRYMDIIYRDVLEVVPPERVPLFTISDKDNKGHPALKEPDANGNEPSEPFRPDKDAPQPSCNITSMQSHLFSLLRAFVAKNIDIRNALARCRAGDIAGFENVLQMVERAVARGLLSYESGEYQEEEPPKIDEAQLDPKVSSATTLLRCKRPWWIAQPYVRPLPIEAMQKGAIQLSKKDKKRLLREEEERQRQQKRLKTESGVPLEGTAKKKDGTEVPENGLVCG